MSFIHRTYFGNNLPSSRFNGFHLTTHCNAFPKHMVYVTGLCTLCGRNIYDGLLLLISDTANCGAPKDRTLCTELQLSIPLAPQTLFYMDDLV
jgi:hypothetical protein